MKIAVLGTGVVGQTIAEKLHSLGHQVMVGTRSESDTLAKSKPDSFGRPAFKDWLSQHPDIQFGPYEKGVRLWGALQTPMFNFKIVVGPQPS